MQGGGEGIRAFIGLEIMLKQRGRLRTNVSRLLAHRNTHNVTMLGAIGAHGGGGLALDRHFWHQGAAKALLPPYAFELTFAANPGSSIASRSISVDTVEWDSSCRRTSRGRATDRSLGVVPTTISVTSDSHVAIASAMMT